MGESSTSQSSESQKFDERTAPDVLCVTFDLAIARKSDVRGAIMAAVTTAVDADTSPARPSVRGTK
jgi:hypothetical protein